MNLIPKENPILLTRWCVISQESSDPYQATELKTPSLNGYVHGHPRFLNGKQVTTSRVVGKNASDHVLTSSGSIYELGEPHADYLEKFPDARRRVLDSLALMH